MAIHVDYAGQIRDLEFEQGQTILDVLQAGGIEVRATCGGKGKCGRCQVLVRDEQGLNYRLACLEQAKDGIEVIVEQQEAMTVVEDGVARQFPPDEGASGFGMAVDIGTTTVVAYLHKLDSGMRIASVSRANPQIAFGADVISRITASVEGKLDLMTSTIQRTLADMKEKLCHAAMIEPGLVSKVTIAGNTTMQHIAVGLPPDSIGVNPFIPLSLFGDEWDIEGLGKCYLFPCVASYVGGDITSGMLSCHIDDGKTRLFMDLGTNGEMALAADGKIVSCATAAGPVFEGANIYFGMPASPGAISKVEFEQGQMRITTIGDRAPIGICGTGIIDAIAVGVRSGAIDESGLLLDPSDAPCEIAPWLGMEGDRNVMYLTEDRQFYITQKDVRSMQLAKAAVCAGVYTMMDHYNVSLEQIEKLEIAGGFGKFLNLKSAAEIGLFPKELLDVASSVGNTSASGASAVLISSEAKRQLERIKDETEYLELSVSKEFNAYYVEAMSFEQDD